ncbi:BLUF domain-containing protein [Wenzhouxiangella sp. XN79A]|uniref:BLUF domain-containing protein n=1 Tax=Wenzhouxiangella sp. XN79A TaxID=2724193 RepID=UPI00144A8219|nr:BLUF domain-containing protein [Wenzhouxiangella sp. XN79A]NKI34944.1 BLUF domain-containing protein [Wenzhouxiangella sp. XN79A]
MHNGSDLIGLSYCSTAAFKCAERSLGVHAEVQRILVDSRRNNCRHGISGVLHFADGRFFQYLEGPADRVDALYARICRDARHSDVRRLTRRPLPRRRFDGLAMKFVSLERPIERVLERHGLQRFDPDRFTPALIEDLVMSSIPERECAPEARPETPPGRPGGSFWQRLLRR